MITDIKINKATVEYPEPKRVTGLNVDMKINGLDTKDQNVEINFTYTVNYLGQEKENVANLIMDGTLRARESIEDTKKIKEEWDSNKKIPDAFTEVVMNSVNFFCSSNGTLLSKAVNLVPPIIPPRIQIRKKEE